MDKNFQRGHKFLYYWLPVILYCLLIFIQSSLPSSEKIPPLPFMDKFLHIGGYALLGFLFLRAWLTQKRINGLTALVILSALSATLYGVGDEIHQHFVSSRSADVFDVLADMVGSVVGATCAGFFIYKPTRK